MAMQQWWTGTHTCRTWKCCGLQWDLLLSRLYPKRYSWKPVCPICKKAWKDR